MKYKFEKVDGIKPIWEENLPMMLGTCVHDTLEYLYKQVSKFIIPTQDQIISYFQTIREKAIRSLKANHNTLFGTIKITDGEIEQFQLRGIEYLKSYYSSHHPFNQYKLLETEKMIHFKLEGDIYFTGKIDRVDLDGRSLIIHDYKTNTKLLPDESDKVAEQINLYGLGMKELYASKVDSVRGAAHYLHFDRSYEREIDNQKLQAVKSKYLNLAREIESKKKQFALGDHDAFPCITGTHCNYCPFRQLCPARKHEYMGDEELSTSNQELSTIEDHLTLHQLIDKYKETKDEIKTLEDMLDMYKEMLVNYAVSRGLKRLFSPNNTLQLTSRTTASFTEDDMNAIEYKLKQIGIYDELLSIDKHKLMSLIKTGTKELKDFDGLVQVKTTSYISRATSKGKEEDGVL